MAARPIWRGHLRLALVSCPVALLPARHERANLHFNFINPETGNRVRMITQDAETGEELSRGNLVRGFEFKKDHYVLLTDEDFESARIESSSMLTIDKFVPKPSIDAKLFDTTYLLVPDGDAGLDVYAVLRDAIAKRDVLALSRLVISRRERAVAIGADGIGLALHTLHEAADLNDASEAFADVPTGRSDAAMVKLAEQLIERQTGEYDPADFEDRYEARLREVIDAKVKGTGLELEPPEEPDRGNVIDLMAALKRSLGQGDSSTKSKPVRSSAGKPPARVAKQAALKRKAAPPSRRKRSA